MKNVLFLIALTLGFLLGSNAVALEDRCLLTGNTYIFKAGDIQYKLSGFECTFGPGCSADCDLWYGNFAIGPVWYERLPFTCFDDGDAIIYGLPCGLTPSGNLECLLIDSTNYKCQKIGTKIWCVPEEFSEMLLFKKQ